LGACRDEPKLGSLFDDQIIALSYAAPADGGNDPPGSTTITVTPGLQCAGQYDTYDIGIVNNSGSLNLDVIIPIIAEHNIDVAQRTNRKDYAIVGADDHEGPCNPERKRGLRH